MYTYLYFLYLRVYPCLGYYRVLLHLMYSVSLTYQLMHNLNRLSIQFEILIANLEEDPLAFERLISHNIRAALSRRLRREIQRLHGLDLSEADLEESPAEEPEAPPSDREEPLAPDLHDSNKSGDGGSVRDSTGGLEYGRPLRRSLSFQGPHMQREPLF